MNSVNTTDDKKVLTETVYALATHAYENGRYEEALPLFRFLCLEESSKRHWMGLGATLLMLKQFSEALPCYGLAALEDAEDPYVHLYAADCLFALDNIQGALLALEATEKAAIFKDEHEGLRKQVRIMRQAWEEKKCL